MSMTIILGRLVLRLNTREPFVENVNDIIPISLDEGQDSRVSGLVQSKNNILRGNVYEFFITINK